MEVIFIKYQYGDVVLCKALCNGTDVVFPMLVISYDSHKNKYLCLDTTEYSPGDYGTCLCLISKDELVMFDSYDAEYSKQIKTMYTKLFPPNINTYYFDLYELNDNKEVVLVRKAILHRKEFEIPTKQNTKLK